MSRVRVVMSGERLTGDSASGLCKLSKHSGIQTGCFQGFQGQRSIKRMSRVSGVSVEIQPRFSVSQLV